MRLYCNRYDSYCLTWLMLLSLWLMLWSCLFMLKKNNPKQNRNNNRTNRNNTNSRASITVPYNKGLSESFKNIGKKFGIQVHFKSRRTLKEELVAPKDKDHITKKSGVIYRFKCDRLECDE